MVSRNASIAIFIAGIAFIFASFLIGEARAGLFIIFPFIYGTGIFMFIGIILILIAMLVFAFSFPSEFIHEGEYEIKEKKGGIILIGPIPIIITGDRKLALLLVIISIIFISFFLAFLFVKI